jgi:hypothetical protein
LVAVQELMDTEELRLLVFACWLCEKQVLFLRGGFFFRVFWMFERVLFFT